MSAVESPDEIRDRHLREMGAAIGPLFHALWLELVNLHLLWHQYTILFATTSSHVPTSIGRRRQ